MRLRAGIGIGIGIWLASQTATAATIAVGGFSFEGGEAAFADDAFLASGSGVRHTCLAGAAIPAASIGEALSGSDLGRCVNVSGGGDGIVEVRFLDNRIQNAPGSDLVIFEGSGLLPIGTPEPAERFGVSVLGSSGFTEFTDFDPVATGFSTPNDALHLFAVAIDLSAFGIAPGAQVDRIRLHLRDNGAGSKGADITAVGALHSVPVPEPGTGVLVAMGLAALGAKRSIRDGSTRG
ncbi:MAG: PEP-CTERM sorting domain-containing protein [Myxococcota bacterium]